ncbi:MAG: DUF3142 domain-containing protein [Nitrospirae bacterium]|nr:DUF3142 domain-containing protein [Nitrospirota bacterium]
MSESPQANPADMKPPDLLYIATGVYRMSGNSESKRKLFVSWPDKVPRAAGYLAVIRVEGTTSPELAIIPELLEEYLNLKSEAAAVGHPLIGLQIDFDCPAGKLSIYADFLRRLRTKLPKEDRLSITALLDWFNPGNRIADALQWVDEYVPQFYDVILRSERNRDSGIAMPIDAAKWAPIFNSYKRPYRVGISAFGRIAQIEADSKTVAGAESSMQTVKEEYYRYSSLLNIMRYGQYKKISEKMSRAGEKILLFKRTDIPNYNKFLKVTIPTKESLLSAYEAAKAMRGFCRGIVFYRWPAKTETMVLTPDEIGKIISSEKRIDGPIIESRDGYCALVSCTDLYVRLPERFSEKYVRLRISSSTDLEYFIPAELMKGSQSGIRTIEVKVPPYESSPSIYLGRAVTATPPEFRVEEGR